MNSPIRSLFIAALVWPSSVLIFSVLASAQGVKNPGPPQVLEDQEQILSYWTAQGGWHSELQLRNNLPEHDLTVTPVLRGPDGAETPLPAVIIKPQEVQSINLGVALNTYAPQLIGSYGSVALRYRAYANRNLYAAIMVHDTGHPIAFHIDASSESSEYDGASREGIWWLPNDTAKDILVLTNQGKHPLVLGLSIYDADGKEVRQQATLSPRQTSIYSVRDLVNSGHLSGTYGGIRVQALEHGGSLDTLHAVYDETAGFSALLKMFDCDPAAKIESRDFAHTSIWTQRAPMLALSIPDEALHFPAGTILQPQIFVRNAAKRKVTTRVRFVWRNGDVTGKSIGPVIVLGPNQTQRIDVGTLQNSGVLPANAHWASVILTSDGPPDEIVAVSASYDATLRYGAQTPFSDQLASKWVGGKWEVDSMHDSLIAIGNGGTKPVSAAFTIFYNRGQNRYELEQALQPDEQMWIDVGKLIHEHIPDKNGKYLPAELQTGSYSFHDLTNRAVGSLFEGKVIYDKSFGHVAYGCSACCGVHSVYLTYNPFYTIFGPGYTNGVEINDNCGDIGWPVDFPNWDTANHAVATTTVTGTHTGISVGSTTSSTWGYIQRENTRGNCPQTVASPSGPTNVTDTFGIAYSSYIPVDHVTSVSACTYNGIPAYYTYMGDANRGTSRTYESITLSPTAGKASGFYAACGQSRQYGYGSPANGSTLSSLDEDGIPNDCHLWNASATASSSGFTHNETYSGAQAQELFIGSASDPLEPPVAPVTWNMNTLINVSNPSSPTATVNYNHTCYPSHQVVVNRATVYLYTPPSNTFAYIAICLAVGANHVTGQTSPVAVPVH